MGNTESNTSDKNITVDKEDYNKFLEYQQGQELLKNINNQHSNKQPNQHSNQYSNQHSNQQPTQYSNHPPNQQEEIITSQQAYNTKIPRSKHVPRVPTNESRVPTSMNKTRPSPLSKTNYTATTNNTQSTNYKRQTLPNEHYKKNTHTVDIEKLDPFYILKKTPKITLDELRHKYKKLAFIHHPDKGGSGSNFNILITALKEIDKLIEYRKSDRTHLELKNNYREKIETEDKSLNINLQDSGKDFKLDKFNDVFNNTRLENFNDRGYGEMMDQSSKNRDDIDIENTLGKYTTENFNSNFNSIKQKNVSNRIIKYKVPEAVTSNKLSYQELGETVDDFSHKVNDTIYTDYKKAYENNYLINSSEIGIKNYKDINELEKDRENLQLSQDQLDAIELDKKAQEHKEWNRLQLLKEHDTNQYEHHRKQNKLFLNSQ